MRALFKPDLRRQRWWALASAIALAASGVAKAQAAAEEAPLPVPEFRQIAPLPAVKEAAAAGGFVLDGVAPTTERTRMAPGDLLTAVVSLTEGRKLEQWLIELATAEPLPDQKKTGRPAVRLFSSSGREFRFGSERVALAIRLAGPLDARDAGKKAARAPEIKKRRVNVSADYLALGLDRVPASLLRVKAAQAANPNLPSGSFGVGQKPFPPETTATARQMMEAVGLMEADERAFAGAMLALLEFFQITASTPGLQDVLKRVIDVPWWSILRSGGKMPAINFEVLPMERKLNAGDWGEVAAGSDVYAYPFQLRLNGKPALLCQLAVVAPRPPLLLSAGIIGVAAGRPDGKGPVLTLQVVATRSR